MDASRVVVLVGPMLVLLWIVCTGYKFATETQSYDIELECKDIHIAVGLGAMTVAFGLFSFILGLSLVAELALALFAWSEEDTKASKHQEIECNEIRRVLARTSVTTISVCMLIWTIYYVHKLVNEPLKEEKLRRLSFLVGIIAIAFGLTNFLIGVAILADTAKRLPAHLQEKLVGLIVHEDDKINTELEV